jgi:thymidine kinase
MLDFYYSTMQGGKSTALLQRRHNLLSLGKQVLVEIEGGDVELDREMIEIIRDPLVHIEALFSEPDAVRTRSRDKRPSFLFLIGQ